MQDQHIKWFIKSYIKNGSKDQSRWKINRSKARSTVQGLDQVMDQKIKKIDVMQMLDQQVKARWKYFSKNKFRWKIKSSNTIKIDEKLDQKIDRKINLDAKSKD